MTLQLYPSVARVPYYRVMMQGEDITGWVSGVSVVEDDHQADHVSITIPDPRMIYADALFEGSLVEVDAGYAEPNQHALMIRALITKVTLSYPESGIPTLTLEGEDKSILMGLKEKKALWRNMTVTAAVRKIAGPYFKKIQATLSPDPQIVPPINQDGKTDLAFLQELAQKYHAKCFVELDETGEEVLYFLPERRIVTLRRPETLILRYRRGPDSALISFAPAFDSGYIDRLKEINDIDDKGRKIKNKDKPQTDIVVGPLPDDVVGRANSADRPIIRKLYDLGKASKLELQKTLTAKRTTVGKVAANQTELDAENDALEGRRLGMTATGTTFGNIWLRAKSKLTIDGVNARFSGDWYVSSVTHKLDTGGYKTDFKCVR